VKALGAVHHIRKVKVDDVVSCDDVGVNSQEEVSPLLEHLLLSLVRVDLGPNDWRTLFESEHIADKRVRLPVDLDDVGDLDYGIRVRCWEFALLCRALNIKAQNAQWRNL
jgi:hypothetical protein